MKKHLTQSLTLLAAYVSAYGFGLYNGFFLGSNTFGIYSMHDFFGRNQLILIFALFIGFLLSIREKKPLVLIRACIYVLCLYLLIKPYYVALLMLKEPGASTDFGTDLVKVLVIDGIIISILAAESIFIFFKQGRDRSN